MKQAFSLLEVIFTIAIIGLITSVAMPKLFDTKENATATTIQQDISTITTAIQSYYLTNNKIDNITDAVTINSSIWDIEKQNVKFKDCITISIEENKLIVDINENDTSSICQKLSKHNIKDITYNLQ